MPPLQNQLSINLSRVQEPHRQAPPQRCRANYQPPMINGVGKLSNLLMSLTLKDTMATPRSSPVALCP